MVHREKMKQEVLKYMSKDGPLLDEKKLSTSKGYLQLFFNQ